MPNISPADKVSLYSITPIKVAATGSTDAKIEAFPLSKFLRPEVYSQNASTVLKKPNLKLPMLPQSIPARITIPDASFFIILPPYIQKG